MRQYELKDFAVEARAQAFVSRVVVSRFTRLLPLQVCRLVMRSFGVLSCTLALTFLLAAEALGQSGSASITVNGHVSEAVFISIAPGAQLSGDELPLAYSNLNPQSIRLLIYTSASDVRRISIPVQLRSNVPYTLSASANLNEAILRNLCIAGARATGRFVAAAALNATNKATCEAATAGLKPRAANPGALFNASPSALLTGPRISMAGTFDTPFNALEVMLLIEVEQEGNQEQGSVELILSASPAR